MWIYAICQETAESPKYNTYEFIVSDQCTLAPLICRILPLSLIEERQLLQRLQLHTASGPNNPKANRLKRKLIVRQIKRERGCPLFDLDLEVTHLYQARGLIPAMQNNKQVSVNRFYVGIYNNKKNTKVLLHLPRPSGFALLTWFCDAIWRHDVILWRHAKMSHHRLGFGIC